MRGALRAGITIALTGLVAGAVPALGAGTCKPAVSPADEAVLQGLINAERRAEHVPKVTKRVTLLKQGRKKSMQMARGGVFSHAGAMAWAQGHRSAQNIAQAPSAIDAFQAMLNSPEHRANMLSRDYRLTGVGAARDCTGQIYFTVNLMAAS